MYPSIYTHLSSVLCGYLTSYSVPPRILCAHLDGYHSRKGRLPSFPMIYRSREAHSYTESSQCGKRAKTRFSQLQSLVPLNTGVYGFGGPQNRNFYIYSSLYAAVQLRPVPYGRGTGAIIARLTRSSMPCSRPVSEFKRLFKTGQLISFRLIVDLL